MGAGIVHFRDIPLRYPRFSASLLVLLLGGILLALSLLDVVPMRTLAEKLSSDGSLSATYRGAIETTQRKLAWALIGSALLCSSLPVGVVKRGLLSIPGRVFYVGTGVLTLALTLLVQEWLFDGIPHVTDAISHLFQAHIFAAGHFFAPAPPCPDAFYQYHVFITASGKWFTKYTPGHALLLAAGLSLGMLKWVMPLCATGSVVLLSRLVDRHDSPWTGRIFAILMTFSPLALLIGGSFMSHGTAMFCSVAGLVAFIHLQGDGTCRRRCWWGVLSGVLLGYSALIRPHEFVMLGLIVGLFYLFRPAAAWVVLYRRLPAMVAGLLIPLVIWMVWNKVIYGGLFVLGYGYSGTDVLHPAFQGHFGLSDTYTVRDALAVLVWNVDRVNRSLLGWPSAWLWIPLAFLSPNKPRLLVLALLGVGVVAGVYFFYDYRSEFEGRYYYAALPFLIFLIARGLQGLAGCGSAGLHTTMRAQVVFLLVVASYLHAAINYWPDYLVPVYGHDYEAASAGLANEVETLQPGRSLVLLDGADANPFVYSSGFIRNDPWLSRNIIYARYDADELDCLLASYPDRAVYHYRAGVPDAERWSLLRAALSATP